MSLYDTLYDELSNGTSAKDIIKLLARAQYQVDEDNPGWNAYWGSADDYDLHECIEDLAYAMTAFEIATGTIETKDAPAEYDCTINELKTLARIVAQAQSKTSKVHDNDKDKGVDALKAFIDSLN